MEPGEEREAFFKRERDLQAGWNQRIGREEEAKKKWWVDGVTDPKVLDEYLAAQVDLYHWRIQNTLKPDTSGEEREQLGERYLFYKRIAQGSYHHEKTEFCLELAQGLKKEAKSAEARLQQPAGARNERDRQLDRKIVTSNRSIAANCLRMAANCLTMPETDQGAAGNGK